MAMDITSIITELDAEIGHLQQIRSALVDGAVAAAPKKRGRPKGSKNVVSADSQKKKGGMSEEGRKRIAEAQRRRWAQIRKTTK